MVGGFWWPAPMNAPCTELAESRKRKTKKDSSFQLVIGMRYLLRRNEDQFEALATALWNEIGRPFRSGPVFGGAVRSGQARYQGEEGEDESGFHDDSSIADDPADAVGIACRGFWHCVPRCGGATARFRVRIRNRLGELSFRFGLRHGSGVDLFGECYALGLADVRQVAGFSILGIDGVPTTGALDVSMASVASLFLRLRGRDGLGRHRRRAAGEGERGEDDE
jgi:hypothetical protein